MCIRDSPYNTDQLSTDALHLLAAQKSQFQPGTYPQLKRSSLSNIPIYENIDGYPDIVSHQMASLQQIHAASHNPPPPPPYTAPHTIVSADALAKSSSRYNFIITIFRFVKRIFIK